MKKKISVVIFIMLAVMLSATDLSPSALVIQKNSIAGYNVIKSAAIVEWGTDHGMVLYTINTQCDSSMNVLDLVLTEYNNFSIFVDAVVYWSASGMELYNMTIIESWLGGEDYYTIFTIRCDWCMVEYEYKNQVASAGSY